MRHFLRSLFLLALTGSVLQVLESNAMAQGYYGPPPGYYRPAPRHAAPSYYAGDQQHDGLFVRGTVGMGYLTASESSNGVSYTYSGFGLTLSGAIGGTIAPNLVLFGEILGTSVVQADLSETGYQGASGYDLTMFGFGPGMAYYVEPINLYFSGTLAFTKISFTDSNSQYLASDTSLGVGISFMVGKEWWVGRDLGVGIAGQAHVASMNHPDAGTRMTAAAFSLLFSASFN
jgi:hypothetical protein